MGRVRINLKSREFRWLGGEVENREFIPEKPRKVEIRSRIEKVDNVIDNRKESDVEFSSERWQKGEVDNWKYKNGNVEINESDSWKAGKMTENGEFVLEKWHNT